MKDCAEWGGYLAVVSDIIAKFWSFVLRHNEGLRIKPK
jgi:hypothetical protein